jgi:hypothetical protein
MTYTGPERRGDEPGRRRPDDFMRYCPEHEMRVELANERHGQAAKRDEHICQKVTSLDSKIDKRVTHLEGILEKLRGEIVGRWTFWVVIGMISASIGTGLFQQHWAFKEILTTLHQVEQRSIRSEEKIESLETAVEGLGKRQDILRDQNLKLLDKVGNLNGG